MLHRRSFSGKWMRRAASAAALLCLVPLAAACSHAPAAPNPSDTAVAPENLGSAVSARLDSAERAARRALRAERALRGARAMFAPDEAEILVTATGIRVRFLAPLFEESSARFLPSAVDRLGRLRAAASLFPDPKITVHAPAFGEGSRDAMLMQMRAGQLRHALVRAKVAREDRLLTRLDTHGVRTLEVAISNEASFDTPPDTTADMASL